MTRYWGIALLFAGLFTMAHGCYPNANEIDNQRYQAIIESGSPAAHAAYLADRWWERMPKDVRYSEQAAYYYGYLLSEARYLITVDTTSGYFDVARQIGCGPVPVPPPPPIKR